MTVRSSLLDLPLDVLLSITPYLDAPSFLNLTSTCTTFHFPDFLNDARYWSTLVRTTFRVPNQPVVQHDGRRWHRLYKRLLTQSKIYTWGNNEKGCLGHSNDALPAAGPPGARRVNAMRRRHVSWPHEMEGTHGLGVISDLQCGGWSTTLLTAKGALYTVGVIDGLQFNPNRVPHFQMQMMEPTLLRYPPGFAAQADRYEPATAIKQFSAGRAHVLGLSDSGRIWSWQNVEDAALHVKFLQHETTEDSTASRKGRIIKVQSGWNKSAALVQGTGIVLWEALRRGRGDNEIEDTALVMQTAVVPRSHHLQSIKKREACQLEYEASLADTVGEVLNFVVLESVVLFNTHLGKVFTAQITWNDTEQRIDEPYELTLTNPDSIADAAFATDVQGTFRSFAVFTKPGAVLTSHQDRLQNFIQNPSSQHPLFTRIPALQNHDVISVAFGDYHFHALHSSGYITSYGNEPQACGTLGLGGHDPEGRLRGIRYQGVGGDGRLVPHAYTEGRRVWFEPEKREWIKFITAGGVDPEEAAARIRMALGHPDVMCQGEVSEWIEQQGRDWEGKFGVQRLDDDDLGAYFALSVTAAGWHSGALMLVNEDLAERVRIACEVPDAACEKDSTNQAPDGDAAAFSVNENIYSLVHWLFTTSLALGRWLFGLQPYAAVQAAHPTAPSTETPPTDATDAVRVIHPRNFGESPREREGVKYAWAGDHFPRLRLIDGTEMPGSVPFDEWRYGRPEFDMAAGV